MPSPLRVTRVLDLGAFASQPVHGLAVSMAARLCLGYGATVVRPLPSGGEPLHQAEPCIPGGGSALDTFLNAGKSTSSEGAYDVVIGDTPSVAARGLDARVKVRISVFGPGEDPPASELSVSALSGMLDIVGDVDGPPTRLAGHQIAYATGLSACTGLLAALLADHPETVDVSLFDVAAWLNWKVAAGYLLNGVTLRRGNRRNHWRVLEAADGHVALVYQEKDWPALRDMVGDPRLREPRFATIAGRADHAADLLDLLRPWFASRTRAEATGEAQRRRIPIGPVLLPSDLVSDPQHRARGFVGPRGMPRMPLLWDGARLETEDAHAG